METEQSPQRGLGSMVLAVVLALACWASVALTMLLTLGLVVGGSAEAADGMPEWLVAGLGAVWTGGAFVVATRFAAGVLCRRGLEQVRWIAALPSGLYLVAVIFEGIPQPVWPTMLQGALAIGGSIAAITVWPPAPPRRPSPR